MQATNWGMAVQTVVCDKCDWNFLLGEGSSRECPHCFEGVLQDFDASAENLPHLAAPELLISYRIGTREISSAVERFAEEIPFPPKDLNSTSITNRAQRIFLPMWLLDAHVEASWQAELGFPYQVESHKSSYSGGQWYSEKVLETRLDWEKRLGRLSRDYQNISAPALDQHQGLMRALGGFPKRESEAYSSKNLQQAYVRLPQRSTKDAFPDAQENFKERAGEEVQEAAAAEKIRDFRWTATYSSENWTLMLLPIYLSYYTDDEDKKRLIFVNGQSAYLSGEKRASMKRARQVLIFGLALAAIAVLLALVVASFYPELENIAAIGTLIAGVIGLSSVFPMIQVWQFNQRQEQDRRA